jgi:hypothetical protein
MMFSWTNTQPARFPPPCISQDGSGTLQGVDDSSLPENVSNSFNAQALRKQSTAGAEIAFL